MNLKKASLFVEDQGGRERGKIRGRRLEPAQWDRLSGESQRDSRPGTGRFTEHNLIFLCVLQDCPFSGFPRKLPPSTLLLL